MGLVSCNKSRIARTVTQDSHGCDACFFSVYNQLGAIIILLLSPHATWPFKLTKGRFALFFTSKICVAGKYMQMMNVLKPIAFDVVICMSQLFDYYLFSVSIYLMLFCTSLYAFVSTVTRY